MVFASAHLNMFYILYLEINKVVYVKILCKNMDGIKRMLVVLSWFLQTIGRQKSPRKHTLLNSAVWPVPYACGQQYQPSSGNHGQLLRPSLGLIIPCYSANFDVGGGKVSSIEENRICTTV